MAERQRTIKRGAVIKGIGLQTGRPVTLRIFPADTDKGIVFRRSDLRKAPAIAVSPLNLKESKGVVQRTILSKGHAEVHTVEHLLSALSGLYIDNILIEIDNIEVPGLDGSAKGFVEILRDVGVQEQDAPRRYVEVERPIICQDREASIQVLPDERFRVEYFMDYDHPLLREQWVDVTLDGSADSASFFEKKIAPARTFHVDTIKRPFRLRFLAGLGRGANYDVTLVIRKDGPVHNEFRFPDEPARHKLLDLIGDLYLFGSHIKGRVIAKKSGHRLNNIFVKKLQSELEISLRQRERGRDRHRGDTKDNAPSISVLAGR